jgi:hypothetical protein
MAQVEESFSRSETGFKDFAPGDLTDQSVSQKSHELLEGLHGQRRARSKNTVDAAVAEIQAHRRETGL